MERVRLTIRLSKKELAMAKHLEKVTGQSVSDLIRGLIRKRTTEEEEALSEKLDDDISTSMEKALRKQLNHLHSLTVPGYEPEPESSEN